ARSELLPAVGKSSALFIVAQQRMEVLFLLEQRADEWNVRLERIFLNPAAAGCSPARPPDDHGQVGTRRGASGCGRSEPAENRAWSLSRRTELNARARSVAPCEPRCDAAWLGSAMFKISYAEGVADDLTRLTAYRRKAILDAIEKQLRYE